MHSNLIILHNNNIPKNKNIIAKIENIIKEVKNVWIGLQAGKSYWINAFLANFCTYYPYIPSFNGYKSKSD